jgi:peptidoglycan/LPS O-acetylase OafA/YrhL
MALFTGRATAQIAWDILGPYIVFWAALRLQSATLQRINNKTDISYGTYLYAWPITSIIVMHLPSVSPFILTTETLVLAMGAGYISWCLIEKPAINFARRTETLRKSADDPLLYGTQNGIELAASDSR